jgi:pentatricopeptide repeat protein
MLKIINLIRPLHCFAKWVVVCCLIYTLATISKVSGELEDLVLGKMIHGKSVRIGFVSDIVVGNSVMSMYCKCGEFGDAIKVFDEMLHRNVGSFNVIISGRAALGSFDNFWTCCLGKF